MEGLKPCPFCGWEAKLREVNMGHGAYGAAVICTNCGCQSNAYPARLDWCANDKAVAAWNRRYEPQELDFDYEAEDG